MEKLEIDLLVAALERAASFAQAAKTDHAPGSPESYKAIANDMIEHPVWTFENQVKIMTPFILEMKVQIDRWDLVTKLWIFNSSIKPFVLNSLKDHINEVQNKESGKIEYYLWGAACIFTPNIQVDKILAIDNENITYPDFRYACLGKLDKIGIQRLLDIKAFW